MFHANGIAPVADRSVSRIDEPARKEDLLDQIARAVQRGRRDRNSFDRIVREYRIADDAGIRDEITSQSLNRIDALLS